LFATSLVSGNMIVNGTSGNDTIVIWQDTAPNPDVVHAQLNGNDDGSYTVNQITGKVKVNCGAGADDVGIESSNWSAGLGGGPVTELCEIYGDAGSDTLWGGDNGDVIQGGADNDDLVGFRGNDIIYGGYGGSDTVNGGDDNDLLYGGDGGTGGFDEVNADTLYGEDGNDTLYGEAGDDYLDPGLGSDYASGGAGQDVFRGSYFDFATDSLDGGAGGDDPGTANTDYNSPGDILSNM
jgi:Ca2+-binding RTX toxin-like protein